MYEFKILSIEDWEGFGEHTESQMENFLKQYRKELFDKNNTSFDVVRNGINGQGCKVVNVYPYFYETGFLFKIISAGLSESEKEQVGNDVICNLEEYFGYDSGLKFKLLTIDYDTYTIEMDYSNCDNEVIDNLIENAII
tara:strand:- start:6373 stop:6789 length:417 start_codon:yes stop_codon:yes gene_type:complete